jgi:hypothetical protein
MASRWSLSAPGFARCLLDRLEYGLRCSTYDSFGEDAFQLTLRPRARTQPGGASAAQRRPLRPEV